MSDDEMKALVAEARRHAEALINGTETGDADLLHDMAYALEAAQETIAAFIIGGAAQPVPKPRTRVVPRPFDSDCAIGICAHKCSHLMWVCDTCSCEGGWGAPQEKLAKMAAEHVCVALSAHPAEETVTTVEALDALPVGSVVQMTGTRAPFYRHSEGWFSTWTEGKPVYDYIRAEHLPARVLYRPVPEGSETA